jgi:hypothetical protein
MLTAEAVIMTGQPDRYLARLGKHIGKMPAIGAHLGRWPQRHLGGHMPPEVREVSWSDQRGEVTLNWGRWTAQSGPGTLTLRAEAADTESLQRIQGMLTKRLHAFGSREHLTITWQPGPGSPGQAG